MFVYKNIRLSITQVIAASFAVVILIGALLLSLPAASKSGVGIPFLNAVFTATSATCVTGLVVYDTFSQFTTFGQVVILLMIQIGGLGFMTIATLLAMAVGKRIGLRERNLLMESVNTLQLGGITRSLSAASKVIIILLMYCGRVGSLTVVMAVAERRSPAKIKNLEEKITIG